MFGSSAGLLPHSLRLCSSYWFGLGMLVLLIYSLKVVIVDSGSEAGLLE